MTALHAAPKLEVPPLAAPRPSPAPDSAERTLPSGLRVVAVRRGSVPLVELRLQIPFAGAGPDHLPRAAVLSEALLSGTASRSNVEIAAELQTVGGGLSAGTDPDRLVLSGNALATGVPTLLDVLVDLLTGAAYPEREVGTERDRLAHRIEMARSQPSHLVRTALLRRLYGEHPYGVETPEPDAVRAVGPDDVRALHAAQVVPTGSVLVLVGFLDPEATLDQVEAALAPWDAAGTASVTPPLPDLAPGPVLLLDRPGAVQSSIRTAMPAVGRGHPDYTALQLANLVFGGYFSSRLVENIREDKGYTYSPHSGIDHSAVGSALVVSADVATEVTAPALLEMGYELGRIGAVPPTSAELEQARQYAIGTLALSIASQGGLAGTLSALAGAGLGLEWIAEHPARLAAVTPDEVAAAAARYLAPAKAVTVVLGDADVVAERVAALGPISRA